MPCRQSQCLQTTLEHGTQSRFRSPYHTISLLGRLRKIELELLTRIGNLTNSIQLCLQIGAFLNCSSKYRRDNRPGINLAFYHSYKGFDFMNRSRFIMRDLEDERPYFRYRNLSKVTMPEVVQAWGCPIRPYVSYEWYFDEGSKDRYIRKNDKFGQFWTDFGLQAKLNSNCAICLFYRLVELKSTSSHEWQPSHVVGTALNFNF